jgi:putative oxidoreductase
MKNIVNNKWMLLTTRCAIGGLFVYAGTIKISNPQSFADSIETFKLLPGHFIGLLALGMPPFEVIIGIIFFVGWQKRLAALAILILSLIFAVAILQGLLRGLPIDCGCLGSANPAASRTWVSLVRDLFLIGAAFGLYRREIYHQRDDN